MSAVNAAILGCVRLHAGQVTHFAAFAKRLVEELGKGQSAGMTRAIVNAYAATLPGASVSDPWGGGHDTWKVGGKMFAGVGARDDHGVDVKCVDVETAQMVIEMGHGVKAKYLHASWVTVPFGLVGDDELRERILTSYQLIRAGLSKKVQAVLGE